MFDDEKFRTLFLVILLGTSLICGVLKKNDLEKKNKELIKENEKLESKLDNMESLVNDYKWQLDQVPFIIEYGCKGE